MQVEQGAVLNRLITWKDANGIAMNLTGFSARLAIKTAYDVAGYTFEMTTSNGRIILGGVAGTITLYASANDTDDIGAGSYVYDLKLIPASSADAVRILQGDFVVTPQVTT